MAEKPRLNADLVTLTNARTTLSKWPAHPRARTWEESDGTRVASVPRRQRDVEPFLFQLVANPLESLVGRNGDRAGVSLALRLARRVLDVALHQLLDIFVERHQRPGVLGVVVHEDVVAFLRVLPEIEDLRDGGDIFLGAFPAEIAVDGETAGRLPVVAAQVEHGLEAADAHRPGAEF